MKTKRFFQFLGILCLLGLLTLLNQLRSSAQATPGTKPIDLTPSSIQAINSIEPYFVDNGPISLSIDALGTLSSSGTIEVEKPVWGATVRAAYLLAATPFGFYDQGPLADGDILLDGYPVNWTLVAESSIYSYNHLADVTGLVSFKLDTAFPGRVDFSVYEADTERIDGVVLAVIFNDPSQTTNNTIALMFGAQNVAGDSFEITFTEPIDKDDPNLVLDMSLGISFGAQGCASGQYSQVDVNGIRLSTSAGGEDDGTCANGALITAGGLDDSNVNPPDPYQTDNGDPRQDDELYDLRPFVADGDTDITVNTLNPSADDNIFFAAFTISSQATISTQPERPVIFIPGFGGSYLNEGDEEIWPAPGRLINNNDDIHLDALILTEEGQDPEDSNITIGDDIVRWVLIKNIYAGTISTLEDLGYSEGDNLFVFPYDFRKEITTTAVLLEEFIRQEVGDNIGGVDIIAHSQGGLVTKKCVLTPSCAELVNSTAILGTPFAGSLDVVRLLEYGMRIPDGFIGNILGVSPNRAKIITQNWPNVYEIIPGPNYYDLFGQGYFIYDRDLDGDGDKEGRLNYNAMKSFLSGLHNADLVSRGEAFQQADGIADWLDGTNGVNVVIFAGSGLPTLTEIREYEWNLGPIHVVRQDFREMSTGDETVPTISVALRNEQGVDFTGDSVNIFYMDRVNHGDLPKNSTLLQYITIIFANTPQRTDNPQMIASPPLPPPPQDVLAEPTYVNGRQFLFTSGVDVEILDQDGNRTGLGEDDQIEVNASGTTYTQIGDTVSIFVYGSGIYTITVRTSDENRFDLKARTVEESMEDRQVLFAGVPMENNTSTAKLIFNTETQSDDVLNIDQNGDGVYEISLLPDSDISGNDLSDIVPPFTSIALEGYQKDDQFIGCVLVTLTAEDQGGGSGIAKIMYSLDDGDTIQEYTSSFKICAPGITRIYAFAVDKAGNVESTASTTSVTILYNLFLPNINR